MTRSAVTMVVIGVGLIAGCGSQASQGVHPHVTSASPTSPSQVEDPSALAACNADAATVQTALEAFQAERGHFPATLTTQAKTGPGSWRPLLGGFLRSVPRSPFFTIWFDNQGTVKIGSASARSATGAVSISANPTACAYEIGLS